jgi:hypothetical protein
MTNISKQNSYLEGIALLERKHATFSKAVTTNSSQLGCRVGTQATDQRLSRLGESQRCREFTSPKTELLSHKVETGIQKKHPHKQTHPQDLPNGQNTQDQTKNNTP